MQIGMIGLGRMGANLVRRLQAGGHSCVVHDVDATAVAAMAEEGATPAGDLEEFARLLETPRVAWVMVPAAFAGSVVGDIAAHFEAGDMIIDGGNSYYRDDIDLARLLAEQGIRHLDVGTSGGVFGLERGFCLMIGGEDDAVRHLAPIFDTLAPGLDAAERTPGRSGDPAPGEVGWLHCGPSGAGHFVKMVHNGIEYGMMAAIAEGLGILRNADIGLGEQRHDAETTPLRDPQYFQLPINVAEVSEVWRRGSVISSWLIDLTAKAMAQDPDLDSFEGRVSDSGEGRWTVMAAVEEGVPAHTITAALYERFASRGRADFADKVLSAMRKEFGGHVEKPAEASGTTGMS